MIDDFDLFFMDIGRSRPWKKLIVYEICCLVVASIRKRKENLLFVLFSSKFYVPVSLIFVIIFYKVSS